MREWFGGRAEPFREGSAEVTEPGKEAGFAKTFPEVPEHTPVLACKPTPLEFFDEMMKLHGDRLNPGPLWYSGLGLLA